MAKAKEVQFEKLFSDGVLVNLQVRMWGATSKLPEDQLNVDEQDKKVIRAVYDLITKDDKAKLELLRTIKNESLGWIKRNSLPSPIREMQFLPKHKIEAADNYLSGQKARYIEAAGELIQNLPKYKNKFKAEHPNLYAPEKYPSSAQLKNRFQFTYVFRMFNVPEGTLQAISPDIYNREVAKFRREMETMKQMIVSEVGKEFLARIDSLKKQCVDGNKINSRTITSINSLLNKFDDLWDGFVFDKALRQTVSDIKEYMEGTDAEMLKIDDDFRKLIGNKMGEFASNLENIKDEKPKRALAI